MSVIMTFKAKGDVAELERRAAGNPDGMRAISRSGQRPTA